jgi:hypothetical protein
VESCKRRLASLHNNQQRRVSGLEEVDFGFYKSENRRLNLCHYDAIIGDALVAVCGLLEDLLETP